MSILHLLHYAGRAYARFPEIGSIILQCPDRVICHPGVPVLIPLPMKKEVISLLKVLSGLCVCAFSISLYADSCDIDSTFISKSLFLDIDRAGDQFVTVGERGHIVVSRDGRQWRKTDSGTEATLTAVFFHDQNNGWAVGHDAVILRTGDGGNSWQQVYAAPELEAPLLDIWFRDDEYGIATGAYGLYLVSRDGGRTWQEEELKVISEAEESGDDGTDLTELYELHLNAISELANGDLIIAAEAGRIYHSDNAGISWRELVSPYSGSFFGVLPLTDSSFAVFGLRGHFYRTQDFGNTWQQVEIQTRELLNQGIRLDDGTVVVVGMGGTLLVSHDDARTMKQIEMAGRNSYAAVIDNNGHLILIGDHGIQIHNQNELIPGHE